MLQSYWQGPIENIGQRLHPTLPPMSSPHLAPVLVLQVVHIKERQPSSLRHRMQVANGNRDHQPLIGTSIPLTHFPLRDVLLPFVSVACCSNGRILKELQEKKLHKKTQSIRTEWLKGPPNTAY